VYVFLNVISCKMAIKIKEVLLLAITVGKINI
jgi:hypothetical protein